MAEAARRRGYSYLVLTDHTVSLAIARGLDLERVERQRRIVAALNERFAPRGGRRDGAARDLGGGLPAAARLRARGPRRRHARLSGRAAGSLRPGRRLGPRRPPPDARAADRPDPGRDPEPQRRHHRPPGRALHRQPRRPRPRLGRRLRGGRPDRHGPRAQRLGRAARPLGRAGSPGVRVRLRLHDRFRRPPDRGARQPPLGHGHGPPGLARPGQVMNTRSRAELLEWAAAKPVRVRR